MFFFILFRYNFFYTYLFRRVGFVFNEHGRAGIVFAVFISGIPVPTAPRRNRINPLRRVIRSVIMILLLLCKFRLTYVLPRRLQHDVR